MKYIIILCTIMVMMACGSKTNQQTSQPQDFVNVPEFDADSAYAKIVAQCDFGPRVPNSEAHVKCGKWIENEFSHIGLEVQLQKAKLKRYDGVELDACNIIAQMNPQLSDRLMIAAHWDSRPWADHDEDAQNHHSPVMAANDGASGVAVMMELARIFQLQGINKGIDFVCFDAEDAGLPEWETEYEDDANYWCLGSQYWAEHSHSASISMGILLDMVGGQGTRFYKEGYSMYYASWVVDGIWQSARDAGYSSYFSVGEGGYITDDHVAVNKNAHVPMIDIVPCGQTGFGSTWHTMQDTPQNIDKNTLKAVGQTMAQFIATL